MRTRTLLVPVLLLAACFVPTEDHTVGSGTADGGTGGASGGGASGTGGGGGSSGSVQRCEQLAFNSELLCTTVFPVVCGGITCASGEVCCQTTGACVAPGSSTCPKPPTTNHDFQPPTSCGSNADCSGDAFCVPDQQCVGTSAHCNPRNNCGYCGPAGSEFCIVCGCDGHTYPSIQAACVAGVSTIHRGPCGVSSGAHDAGSYTVTCGTNAQCPANAQCCFRTGMCFDPAEPWRCQAQPDGTTFNCATDEECNGGSGGGGGSEPTRNYCSGGGCAGGPGICRGPGSTASCGGDVQQVCGCDGVTYVNACWADAAGTQVASGGACL